jgi:4-hydroxybenzoate polyprenyltransferase
MHPWPSLATTLAAIVFALALGIRWGDPRVGAILVTVLMTQLSISTLNDWADRDRDAQANRPKPLVIGHLSPWAAVGLAGLSGVLVLPGALGFGWTAGVVLIGGLAAGWAYDLWLKPTPLSFVPFAIAFPLLPTWVGLVSGRPLSQFVWVIVGGAFLAVAVHLGDSLPDLAIDARTGVRSLAVTLGLERSIRTITACMVAGGLVVVTALASRILQSVLLGLAGLLAIVLLVATARRSPASARWITGSFAIVASVALITRLPPHG